MSDVPTEIKDDEKELDIDPENVKRNETSLNIDCFAERESIGIIKPFACTMYADILYNIILYYIVVVYI